jgi:hypothetical protein
MWLRDSAVVLPANSLGTVWRWIFFFFHFRNFATIQYDWYYHWGKWFDLFIYTVQYYRKQTCGSANAHFVSLLSTTSVLFLFDGGSVLNMLTWGSFFGSGTTYCTHQVLHPTQLTVMAVTAINGFMSWWRIVYYKSDLHCFLFFLDSSC